MFRHILFPIDFSEHCKDAVPFVKAFARQYGAKVTLMHVVQTPSGWYGGIDAAYPFVFDVDEMERQARRELSTFYSGSNESEAQSDVAQTVGRGEPGVVIGQFAQDAGVDLIMMPTHGYGTFRRFLLGSVTAEVLHDAHCAVWTAAHAREEWATHRDCRQILCAVDQTEKSIPVIRRAVELGSELTATVCLVHAVPFQNSDVVAPFEEGPRYFLDLARRGIQDLQLKAGTKLELCMETGNVSDIVRKAALHHEGDLIVIGRGRIQERFGGLRTHAYAIIRDSPCPVLSV
jgi:nucleotide-binding universal stress UspA family protein